MPGRNRIRRLIGLALAFASVTPALLAGQRTWTQFEAPFKLYGNTYYVGTRGLAAILIASPQGLVLIDGTLAENAAVIEANIRRLGFRLSDVHLILNTHAHNDHAGAIAVLQRDSGAAVLASVAGARELALGGRDPEDPQYGVAPPFDPPLHVRTVADGETVRLGPLAITAHYTPGHTPGSTSWSWSSCQGRACLRIVYADSLMLLARPGYAFGDTAAHPHRVEEIRAGLARLETLPCDLLVTPHPEASDFFGRWASHRRGVKPDPLLDRRACAGYAGQAAVRLDQRLAAEEHAAAASVSATIAAPAR